MYTMLPYFYYLQICSSYTLFKEELSPVVKKNNTIKFIISWRFLSVNNYEMPKTEFEHFIWVPWVGTSENNINHWSYQATVYINIKSMLQY